MRKAYETRGIHLDPRTKMLLILLCVIAAMIAPSLNYEFALVLLIACLGVLCGKAGYAVKGSLIYLVLWFLTMEIVKTDWGTLRTALIAFLALLHKVYPCGMLSGIVLSTTKVSEFLSATSRMHVSKKVVIPAAVMLRYLPVIREDWHYIKDGMAMRGISPSLIGFIKEPAMTINCIYVPLMMAASKAADELSIASVTRGIENPKPRTCLVSIYFGIFDGLIIFVFAMFLCLGFYLKGRG